MNSSPIVVLVSAFLVIVSVAGFTPVADAGRPAPTPCDQNPVQPLQDGAAGDVGSVAGSAACGVGEREALAGGLPVGDPPVDDFEDGDLAEYGDVEAARVTTETAYSGTHSLTITDRNEEMFMQNGHHTGNRIHRSLAPSRPSNLSAAVRIDDGTYNDLRVYWRNGSGRPAVGINLDVWRGTFRYNGSNLADVQSYTWHDIEFVDLDWQSHTVGRIVVDGEVVARNEPFLNAVDSVSNVTMSVNDAGTGSKVWFDDVSLAAQGSLDEGPETGERLSFEDGVEGRSSPPEPWFVRADGGTVRVSGDHAGHGERSMYVRGSSGLGESQIAVTLNLTGVAEIRYDVYVERTNTFAGEIHTNLARPDDDGRGTKVTGFTLRGEEVWHNDTTVNASRFEGEWVLFFHARGSDNGGYFDDVRFYDSAGDLVPAASVTVADTGSDNAAPTAAFEHSPDGPAVGESVSFDAAATADPDGSITAYEWDFDGDGAVDATGATVTHAFESAGDRTVTLTVTDDAGASDTATATVSVESAPDSITASRSVPGSIAPGGTASITTTVRVPSTTARLSLAERFTPAFDDVSITDVRVAAGSGAVITQIGQADGVDTAVTDLGAGSTIELTYEVRVGESVPTGTEYTIAGTITAGTTRIDVGNDTLTVSEAGPLGPYADRNGVIDAQGLRGAIQDWALGQIDTDLLRQVIQQWATGVPVT